MSIEEIFTNIANHMLEGIKFHDQVAICYDFIGIKTYAKDHMKQFIEESQYYRSLLHYYSSHYHRLLKIDTPKDMKIIPDSWYKYSTMSVDVVTKQNTIKDLMKKWIDWEKSTRQLYEDMFQAAFEIKDFAASHYIKKLILKVTKELKEAEQLFIDLESISYDMPTIIKGR